MAIAVNVISPDGILLSSHSTMQWKNSPISAEHICLTCSPEMIITLVFCISASIVVTKKTCFRDEIQPFLMGMGQNPVRNPLVFTSKFSFFSLPLFLSPGYDSPTARMMDHQAGRGGMNQSYAAVGRLQR